MATDWEDHYQKRDLPWDKGAASPGLLDFLQTEPIHGSVLVPGCGLGHDVRALAACADEVVGIDIAHSAVEAARAVPNVGGERYEQADFFALPAPMRGAFDWIWEHTCFCAIDLARRPDYVEAAARALRPGG
ncbi:MAG TPA: methyltransferase domain-containing protein, partial [Chthoniobacteraceae bacterium]